MRIALDAMGGDLAPAAQVDGAIEAVGLHADLEVLLVGDPAVLERELRARGALGGRVLVEPSEGVVAMDEEPVRAMRHKPRNSARVAAECVADGRAAGAVNLGSTGAAVAAAALFCRRLEGVTRPGIAVPFPRSGGGVTTVVDAGGNVDVRGEHLYQWALMARHHVRAAHGIASPRVAILSVGEEEHKGNRLVKEAWERFHARPMEGFVGNVEGRDVFRDVADVVVCDGFVGNVLLKAAEGIGEMVLRMAQEHVGATPQGRALLAALGKAFDYAEYGGAPLLGLVGAYVIGHGRSDARAVRNAIGVARGHVIHGVEGRILADLAAAAAAGVPAVSAPSAAPDAGTPSGGDRA